MARVIEGTRRSGCRCPISARWAAVCSACMVAAAAGLHWGSAGAATAAAGAAAIAGATALQDSPRGPSSARWPRCRCRWASRCCSARRRRRTACSSCLVVAAWCFVAGMQWAVSANAGLIAAAAGALLVTAPPVAPTVVSVATATALAVGGGLVQAVLIGLWPRRRWRMQRDALTRRVPLPRRRRAQSRRPIRTARADPAPLLALRDAFTLTDRQARRRPLAYRRLVRPAPAHLGHADAHWRAGPQATRGRRTSCGRPAGCWTSSRGRSRTAKRDALQAHAARRRRRGRGGGIERRPGAAPVQPTSRGGRTCGSASCTGVRTRRPASPRRRRCRPSGDHRGRRRAPEVGIADPAARDPPRGGPAAGVAIERFADVPHGYWIPLTVLMVLRPETAHTYTRCVGRVAGNAVGIVAASVVTMIWHPTGLAAAVLAVLVPRDRLCGVGIRVPRVERGARGARSCS